MDKERKDGGVALYLSPAEYEELSFILSGYRDIMAYVNTMDEIARVQGRNLFAELSAAQKILLDGMK